MAGLYILLWFCEQLKNIQTLSAQVCEVFAVFNSNSSCDLLPCDSPVLQGIVRIKILV